MLAASLNASLTNSTRRKRHDRRTAHYYRTGGDNVKSYDEIIKDFATDRELRDWVKNFSLECEAKHCDGLMAVTAPQSELCWVGARSVSPLSTGFLFSSLLDKVCNHAGISTSKALASLLWLSAQIEAGYVDMTSKTIDKSREREARKLAKRALQKAMNTPTEGKFPTIDAQFRYTPSISEDDT